MLYWLGIILGCIFGLILLSVAASAVVWYVRYLRSPEKQWRNRVLMAEARARTRIRTEQAELERHAVKDEDEERALREQAFSRFLAAISVEELDKYPGIGPATIAKLHDAGHTNIASFQRGPTDVPGLGEKRLMDIAHAVRDLVKQAQSRFDAGACREAREMTSQIQALRASTSEYALRAHARLQAAEHVLELLEPVAELAQRISFGLYLSYVNRPTAEKTAAVRMTLQLPLADLERTVEAADAQAQAAFAESKKASQQSSSPGPRPDTDLFQPQPSPAVPRAIPVLQTAKAMAPLAVRVAETIAPSNADLFREALRTAKIMPPAERVPAEPIPARSDERGSRKAAKAQSSEAPVEVKAPPVEVAPGLPSRAEQLAALEIDLTCNVSADLIRRQYNLLSSRYAAEKFETAGPEFVTMARHKRESILAAATDLIRPFGEDLERPAPSADTQDMRHNPDLDAMFGV
jgi:hypothetical protein